MASGELRAWNPGWIDWAQDKFAGLYGDYRTGIKDARKLTDLFNYAPVAGEAIDLAGFNDALREGRMMDAGIYGASTLLPVLPGKKLVEALKNTKVLDKSGSPLRLFHGTDAKEFKEFKTPSFFTEHADEASAYSFWTSALERQQALERAKRLKLIQGDGGIVDTKVPYTGIIGDIPEEGYGKVWATDQGVVRKNTDGTIELFDGWKTNLNIPLTMDGRDMLVTIQRGDGSKVRDILKDQREFLDSRYPKNVGRDARVYPAYLNIENPVELPPFEANQLGKRLGTMDDKEVAAYINDLQKRGYDGISTVSDEAAMFPDLFNGQTPKQYIPFSPNQIFSAIPKIK